LGCAISPGIDGADVVICGGFALGGGCGAPDVGALTTTIAGCDGIGACGVGCAAAPVGAAAAAAFL